MRPCFFASSAFFTRQALGNGLLGGACTDALSSFSGKAALPPGFKNRNGYGVGEIETALARAHGQAQALGRREGGEQIRRQAACFRAENKTVARRKGVVVRQALAARGQGKAPRGIRLAGSEKSAPIRMPAHVGPLVVIQPGAAQQAVVHGKAQRLNEVQRAARIGRQADDVAGVGRNFGFNQNDVKHGANCPRAACPQDQPAGQIERAGLNKQE